MELRLALGTMIELPRAALTAGQIAEAAEFFSFGTNDLTQTVWGFSRDDVEASFFTAYLEKGIFGVSPFETIDRDGVGALVRRRRRGGPGHPSRPQARHLRRARRRPGVRPLLPRGGPGLRLLLTVPHPGRPTGGRPRRRLRRDGEVDHHGNTLTGGGVPCGGAAPTLFPAHRVRVASVTRQYRRTAGAAHPGRAYGEAMRWPGRDTPATAGRGGLVDRDRDWRREACAAVCFAAALAATLLLIDWADGTLRPWRAVLWCVLSVLLLSVLLPARVTAGEGWLRSRGVLRDDRVRLDRLVAVGWSGAVAPRLVLTDSAGGRVELDPRVLRANPLLWHRIESAARRRAGTPVRGTAALREFAERVDAEALRALDAIPLPDPRTARPSAARTRTKGVRRQRR